MSGERGLPPVDLVSRAYQRIRDLIVEGRLAPGTRIIENDLANHLEISRTPVRAALQRLQQEGWVIGSGTGKQLRLSVSPMTQEDARELFDIIGTLEGLAARWAALLPSEHRADLVEELRGLNRQLREEAASALPDPRRAYELHSAFHVQLVEAIHAPRLRVLHSAIKPQAYRYRQVYSVALIPATAEAAAEHEAVLRHIDAGDPAAAEQAARTNWANAADRMARIIQTWGEKGSW
ncbi:MAG: GntR family transcriptional regulator [Gemmatimonadetes bacterium]|nr:GntR family transcriptional regulator [Gemmatimonadota bacterium]